MPSFFEKFFGGRPTEARVSSPDPELPTVPRPESDNSELTTRIEAQLEQDKAAEAKVLEKIRGRERVVAPPQAPPVDVFLEDESLRTNQAEFERERQRNKALAERLVVLRGLQDEISGIASVNSELAHARMRQILKKRAEMIQQIPRYAEANLQNIQDTLRSMVEEGTVDRIITLSEAEWQKSNEKVKDLKRMLKGLGSLDPEMDTIPTPLMEDRIITETKNATEAALRTGKTPLPPKS